MAALGMHLHQNPDTPAENTEKEAGMGYRYIGKETKTRM